MGAFVTSHRRLYRPYDPEDPEFCFNRTAPAGGGGGYTGPLDIVSGAVVAYGQRALSAAKRGSAVYTIREDAGNTTQSFNSDATTGAVNAAAIISFLNGANGKITVLKDQGANGLDQLQPNATSQWSWSAPSIALGNRPSLLGPGSIPSSMATAGNVVFSSSDVTVFCLCKINFLGIQNYLTGAGWEVSNGGFVFYLANSGAPGFARLYLKDDATAVGATLQTDSTSLQLAPFNDVLFLLDMSLQTASPFGLAFANGAALLPDTAMSNGSAGFQTVTEPLAFGSDDATLSNSAAMCNGSISELLIYPSIVAPADRLAIRQNIAAYYGITLA